MKRLYDCLIHCRKEEEVKAEFCKFFKMKIFALRGIDHYAERVLFEFKYDRNFKNAENVAKVFAQTMYYARLLKFGAGLTKYPLPPYICVVDKNEAFFAETKDYAKFYSSKKRPLRLGPRTIDSVPQPRCGCFLMHELMHRNGMKIPKDKNRGKYERPIENAMIEIQQHILNNLSDRTCKGYDVK